MSDNKQKTDGRDDAKIDKNDKSEVEFVHSQFPSLQHSDIVAAIEAAGPMRQEVYNYIKRKHSL